MTTKRLDILMTERGLAASRAQAQGLILAGEVWSQDYRLEKPGLRLPTDYLIEVRLRAPLFVSRGGAKLNHALELFNVSVEGHVCLDIGASTGGFTDCLLKSGAEAVFAVDVGYGQLDYGLREDPRVIVLERMNARNLTLKTLIDADARAAKIRTVVMDVSFISMTKIIEPLATELLGEGPRQWILLFKPQFEVGRKEVVKGGIVKSPEAVEIALEAFQTKMNSLGFKKQGGPEKSPLPGKRSGNVEYLFYYEN